MFLYCLQRHGISRLPAVEGTPRKKQVKPYPIGHFHVDLLDNLVSVVSYNIHTLLTDNGIQLAKREGTESYLEIPFDRT